MEYNRIETFVVRVYLYFNDASINKLVSDLIQDQLKEGSGVLPEYLFIDVSIDSLTRKLGPNTHVYEK